ncbi:MAG: AEC family transporter [Thermoanaerobaculum sp.]|nr:AEC family transporter [Thermoanaerobaculum sp.]MCX7895405.1 AEC family transporter [Thermoanaerobaculum sp.]
MVEHVLPAFLVLGFGALARRLGFLTAESAAGLNRLAANVALPALLVLTIGTSPLATGFSAPLALVTTLLVVGVAFGSFCLARALGLPKGQRGVFAQASFRGNLAYMAFPVILAALGEPGLRRAALVSAVLIPTMNFLSVLVLHMAQGRGTGWGPRLWSVVTNPLVLGANLGLVLSALSWQPWPWLHNTLKILADFSLPAALLALGAQLEVAQMRDVRRPLLLSVAVKLILLPAFGYFILRAWQVSPLDLQVGVLLLASPTAVASYPVAVEMGGDPRLAGASVLLTTALAFPAFVLWGLVCGLTGPG